MAIIKCKMCGGDLRIEEGSTVCECEYCGTKQTVPSADNEKKLTLFGRAGRLLRACEFDKAAGVFETIVADFPQEAEAYWGLVLCKYGIEYVDDPATGKKIPTCHRSSFDNVMKDPNFEQACENTDAVARRVYRDEARAIEELRKNIIEVSDKEEPYDVFISYKETDANGERTPDSELAQKIYRELSREGYRVFFSRISLESHLGTEYEPYIFAALNSAKVMLVVGTDYENFDAVWVKNEWSRFLKLIAKGEKKTLIPVYKDMDAYDMPEEFSKLTALDMGRIAAMEDLIHGVEKLVGKKKAEPVQAQPVQQVVQQTVVQGGGPNVLALLKRGHQALEDGDWAKAKGFYDQVLSMDAENADAFLGLALAGQQVRDLRSYFDTLSPGRVNVETDTLECDKAHIARSIAQAVVPGYCEGSELKKLYDFTVAYPVKLREETAVTQQIKSRFNGDRNLNRAFRYAQGETKQKLEVLKKDLFDTLDKRVRAAEASDKKALEEAKAEFDAKLEAADQKAEELSRTAQEKREADYQSACKQADEAKEDFEFINAGIALQRVGKYKDADERAKECEEKAAEIKARREQAEREAKEKAEAVQRKKNRKAGIIFGSAAVAVIAVLLLVTQVIVPNGKYQSAASIAAKGRYEEAATAFEALGSYKDAKEQALEMRYLWAASLLENQEYDEANAVFTELGDFKDSAARANEAITRKQEAQKEEAYTRAMLLLSEGDYIGGYESLIALEDYRDSAEKAEEFFPLYKEQKIKTAEVGDSVLFGSYEQDNNTKNGKEDIEWYVLAKKNGRLLLISRYALDCKPYHNKEGEATWETCSLRSWLNGSFLNSAFSSEEQKSIPTVTITDDKNYSWSTSPGNATQDKVFLLSDGETVEYLYQSSILFTICAATDYAFAQGAEGGRGDWRLGDKRSCLWWLRTPGKNQTYAEVIGYYGEFDREGFFIQKEDFVAVRPAIWINLGD